MDQNETTMGGGPGAFGTTRWTFLRERDHAEILRLYWRPVYLHLRRRGFAIEEAKDLTQDFFRKFMERDFAAQADRSRGRFRDFLRAAVDHFSSDARDRARAQKRGGDRAFIPDYEAAEPLLSTDDTPEQLFDRQWARSILEDALRQLGEEYAARGQKAEFEALEPFLAEGTVEDRVALHRARKRFGHLVRERIALTVESPAQVDEEMTDLFVALQRGAPK